MPGIDPAGVIGPAEEIVPVRVNDRVDPVASDPVRVSGPGSCRKPDVLAVDHRERDHPERGRRDSGPRDIIRASVRRGHVPRATVRQDNDLPVIVHPAIDRPVPVIGPGMAPGTGDVRVVGGGAGVTTPTTTGGPGPRPVP